VTYVFHIDPRNAKGAANETAVQAGFRAQMRLAAPRVMLVAVPNAGKRTQWEAKQRQNEGMVAGFPDMVAFFDGRAAGLEFKSGTGSLSENQIATLNKLVSLDIPVGVFRSAETAVEWLKGHWPHAFGGAA
jgi:hypothetical protein